MSARDKLYTYAGTPAVLPESMLNRALDAYRDEVLAEQRTTWPSAAELQQAAATKRAAGTPEDVAVANLLNAVANALAWLAPYRGNEGGFEMWGASTTLAQVINGTAEAPDFFQPGHSYTHRDDTTFRCVAVIDGLKAGTRLAVGWATDLAGITYLTHRNIDHWRHEYDGCAEPTTGGVS